MSDPYSIWDKVHVMNVVLEKNYDGCFSVSGIFSQFDDARLYCDSEEMILTTPEGLFPMYWESENYRITQLVLDIELCVLEPMH